MAIQPRSLLAAGLFRFPLWISPWGQRFRETLSGQSQQAQISRNGLQCRPRAWAAHGDPGLRASALSLAGPAQARSHGAPCPGWGFELGDTNLPPAFRVWRGWI